MALLSMSEKEIFGLLWSAPWDDSLDILAARYAFLRKGDMWPGPLTFWEGARWTKTPLNLRLGQLSEPHVHEKYCIRLLWRNEFKSTHLGVISTVKEGANLAEGMPLVRVSAIDISGDVHTNLLRVGKDTAPSLYESSTDRTAYQKAKVFSMASENKGEQVKELHYGTFLPLEYCSEVRRIVFHWVGPENVLLDISRLSFVDRSMGTSFPVPFSDVHLNNEDSWRYDGKVKGTAIFENLDSMPRAWFATEVRQLSAKQILDTIRTSEFPEGDAFDPYTTALVEEPLRLEGKVLQERGTVHRIEVGPTRLRYVTDATSEQFLVLSDIYYPGWVATVDGEPTKIYRTNYVLRGIKVPAGRHEIKLRFIPKSLYCGMTLSMLSFLAIILIAVVFRSSPFADYLPGNPKSQLRK